ncbi:PREDICTED: cation/H(+) antiporter 15-like [Prunus mume]|uniref:Cation/H(+) antiporter 15-like n=1 Tax=Prunus mume TaxID=102107 RepID=A0ABM0P418_PRUMU|nr:PREDICTED: cation/H(+) antiporter 15-like [Prunus mume]
MASLNNNTQVDVVEEQHCMRFPAASSRGIWFGENPLDDTHPLMLAQIILVVVTYQLLYFLLGPLGQTKFVCNLLSGIILGSSALGGTKGFKDRLFAAKVIPLFDSMASVGAIYALFLATLKFDALRFKRTSKKDTVKIGLALDDLNLMTSELGQFAMSSALLNDVIYWIEITFYFLFARARAGHGIQSFMSLLGLTLFTFYVIRPTIMWIINNIPQGQEAKEVHVVAIQLGVLVLAFISDTLGLAMDTGPILLGAAIPGGPPLGAAIVHKTEYLVSQFLMPIFFYRIGYRLNVFSIRDWTSFSTLQSIIVVSYVSKIVTVVAAAMWCKIGFKNSLKLSIAMSIKGIIDVLIYSRWRATKESIHKLIYLLEASYPTQASPIITYMVHTVELMGRAAPLLIPYKRLECRNASSSTNESSSIHQMMRAFENYSENSRGPVTIHVYNMIASYKSMHDTILRLAHDKVVPLIILPFHDHRGTVYHNLIAPIRQFNINVQTNSPCTVGILVDRGLACQLSSTYYSFNVVVIFIGGADDREALAYAGRMSGNPDVGMTVLRIILRSKLEGGSQEQEIEAKLDQSLIDEFKLANTGDECLNWHDIEVDDSAQAMTAIKKLQGNYDLVMVGRRHVEMSLRDEEMEEFVEHPELGVIGDMLASSDFWDGMVNVLVMQESRGLGYGAFHSDSARFSENIYE